MFHLFRRSPDSEPSPEATPPQAHTRRLAWVVATLLGAVLVVGMVLFPLQAAASGGLSPSTHPPLLKLVPHIVDPDHNDFYCKVVSPSLSVCHVTLTETLHSSGPLHWSTRADASLTPHPSSGKLSPGQSIEVKIDVNLKVCSGGPSVYFIGPNNVVSVEVFCD